MKNIFNKFLWEKSTVNNKGISIKFTTSKYCYIKPTMCCTWDSLLRKPYWNKPCDAYYVCTEKVFYWLWFRITLKVENEYLSTLDKEFSIDDMIQASKYGYEFRDTTSFPEHKFEDACINNTRQWLQWYNNKN